jgi:hypothetical protein
MTVAREGDKTARAIGAGLLTWILPGAGHLWLGHRGLALVFFAAISLPYGVGMALGGLLDSANPRTNPWLCLAEVGVGGYTIPAYVASQSLERRVLQEVGLRAPPDQAFRDDYGRYMEARAKYMSFYPESDVAQIYLATAGLLNLLAILDAISRAQTGGLPTYHRELLAAQREGGT